MNWYRHFSPTFFGVAVVAALVQLQPATALQPPQVNELAKSITVRIDGQFTGSGFIIGKDNDVYTVVTNRHVVAEKGTYVVTTSDNRQYTVSDDQIQRFKDLDLAIIHFSSSQQYTVAQLGESEKVTEGETIYLAGYPNPGSVDKGRNYRFLVVRITGRLDTPSEEGYGLVYDGLAIEGMSGGPVLDGNGKIIGIHGQAEINAIAGAVSNYGIPIKSFIARKGSISIPDIRINLPQESKFQELLSLGNKQKDEGNYQEAIKTYGEALKLNSQSAVVYYNRGWSFNQLKDYQKAIDDLSQAIRLNPQYTDAYVSRSHARYNVGDSQGTLEDCNQALRLNPDYALAYNNRGVARADLGDKKAAIEDYNQAIRLDPNYALSYYNRGIARSDLGDKRAAIQDYNEAIRLDPNYTDAYYNRGWNWGELGEYQRAIEDYNEAIRLDPNYANAYYNRGWSLSKLGDNRGAVKDYTQAIRINPKYTDAYYNRGWSLDELGEYQRSIEDYTEVIRLDANYADAYYNRGNAYANLNQIQKAIADFEKAARLYRQQNNPTWYQNAEERLRELRKQF